MRKLLSPLERKGYYQKEMLLIIGPGTVELLFGMTIVIMHHCAKASFIEIFLFKNIGVKKLLDYLVVVRSVSKTTRVALLSP